MGGREGETAVELPLEAKSLEGGGREAVLLNLDKPGSSGTRRLLFLAFSFLH